MFDKRYAKRLPLTHTKKNSFQRHKRPFKKIIINPCTCTNPVRQYIYALNGGYLKISEEYLSCLFYLFYSHRLPRCCCCCCWERNFSRPRARLYFSRRGDIRSGVTYEFPTLSFFLSLFLSRVSLSLDKYKPFFFFFPFLFCIRGGGVGTFLSLKLSNHAGLSCQSLVRIGDH